MARYLLVAHQTAERKELLDSALQLAAQDAHARFTLLVPATPIGDLLTWEEGEAKEVARTKAKSAAASLKREGITVVGVMIGDADPVAAIGDEFVAGRQYEAIVISTLPAGISRWIKMDVVSRLQRAYPHIRLIHVIADEASSPRQRG
jgi:triosephosphate isomerase